MGEEVEVSVVILVELVMCERSGYHEHDPILKINNLGTSSKENSQALLFWNP